MSMHTYDNSHNFVSMENFGDCLHCKSFSKSIFSCFEKNKVAKSIAPNIVSISYKKGQEVYTEGTVAKGVFCIQSGNVKVYKNCNGRNLTINLYDNSEIIGYTGLFNGGTYINSARCIEDSQICFFPKKNFLAILEENPEVLMSLLKQSCRENYRISNILRDVKCKSMLSRVSNALLEMNKKFGTDENKCIRVNLTRKEIAEISGTTSESVIRILNQLKKEKAISLHDGRIKIIDSNKLQKLCQ